MALSFSSNLGEGHWAQARDIFDYFGAIIGRRNETYGITENPSSRDVKILEETPDRIATTMIWASMLGARFRINERFEASGRLFVLTSTSYYIIDGADL